MDGLQLVKELQDINQKLRLISFVIENPIYKGTLNDNDLSKETTEFIGRSDKLKEQITNIKYINI